MGTKMQMAPLKLSITGSINTLQHRSLEEDFAMNFQMLEYFSVVADCLNISDASRKLYVSQPAISRQIMALESELGVQLFYRTKPYLTLTEAGQSLRNDAERIIRLSHELIDHAKQNAESITGCITVGYSGHLEYPLLFKLFSHMSKAEPNVRFRFVLATLDTLKENLQNGSLDIIFCPLTGLLHKTPEDIVCHVIEHVPSVVAVSENHRLADHSVVNVADLAAENIVAFARRGSTVHNDFLIDFFRRAGFSAHITYEVSDINTFLLMVASNMAVGFVGKSVEKLLIPESTIKLLPLEEDTDLPAMCIGAAWRKTAMTQPLAALVEVLSTLYPNIGV